jgi:hypothetical protein
MYFWTRQDTFNALIALAAGVEAWALVMLWRLERKQEEDRKRVEVFVEMVMESPPADGFSPISLCLRVANLSSVGIWVTRIVIEATDIGVGAKEEVQIAVGNVVAAFADKTFPCHGPVYRGFVPPDS